MILTIKQKPFVLCLKNFWTFWDTRYVDWLSALSIPPWSGSLKNVFYILESTVKYITGVSEINPQGFYASVWERS